MKDLSAELAGVKLKNSLIVGAGPNTKNYTTCVNCIKAGFGGIVIRSLHKKSLHDMKPAEAEYWWIYNGKGTNFLKSFYSLQSLGTPAKRVNTKNAPGFGGAAPYPTHEQWVEEVQKITRVAKEYECKVFAQVGWCGVRISDDDIWQQEAKDLVDAGVDAIELHTSPGPFAEPGRCMMLDPYKYLGRPIELAKKSVNVPVFAKLTADGCDLVGLSDYAQKMGADGLVPCTRWASMTIDTDNEKKPILGGPGYGGPWAVPIMNAFIYRMRNANKSLGTIAEDTTPTFPDLSPVTVPIIPSGGVRFGADVIGYIIAGANGAQICAQVMIEGMGAAKRIENEIITWMDKKGYDKLSDLRGTVRTFKREEREHIPQLLASIDKDLCNGCETCVKSCTNEAISMSDGTAVVDESRCEGCRTCFFVCPVQAVSLSEVQ